MLSGDEILLKLSELKPMLEKDYSVNRIGVFGSYSNSSANDESDIDILVELSKPIGWKFLSLEIYLEKVFNKKIDLVTRNALRDPIKQSILDSVKFA